MITSKLIDAARILGQEEIADDPHFILELHKKRVVTKKQIYSAVKHFGWRWARGRWTRKWPKWLQTQVAKRDAEIIINWI